MPIGHIWLGKKNKGDKKSYTIWILDIWNGAYLVEDFSFTSCHYFIASLVCVTIPQIKLRVELWIKSLDDSPNYEQSSFFVGFGLLLDYNNRHTGGEKERIIWSDWFCYHKIEFDWITCGFLSEHSTCSDEKYFGRSSLLFTNIISWYICK